MSSMSAETLGDETNQHTLTSPSVELRSHRSVTVNGSHCETCLICIAKSAMARFFARRSDTSKVLGLVSTLMGTTGGGSRLKI